MSNNGTSKSQSRVPAPKWKERGYGLWAVTKISWMFKYQTLVLTVHFSGTSFR